MKGVLIKTKDICEKLVKKLSFYLIVCSSVMLFSMIFITTYGVIMRYFFRKPEPWSYELNTILLLWTFILALPFVEFLDQHIRADIFIQYAPKRVRIFLFNIVTPILGVIYCFFLTWKGLDNVVHSFVAKERSMSVIGEPLFPIKLLIPICYGTVTAVILRKLFVNIKNRWNP